MFGDFVLLASKYYILLECKNWVGTPYNRLGRFTNKIVIHLKATGPEAHGVVSINYAVWLWNFEQNPLECFYFNVLFNVLFFNVPGNLNV